MSFLIVNSARAASRAFHLNFRRQPRVLSFSRSQFDRAAGQHVRRGNRRPLLELAQIWRTAKAVSHQGLVLGLTHHRARFDFLFPYENSRNMAFLQDVRDLLDVEHVFFVVRRPEQVFLSELNRQIASRLGDWRFISKNNSWPRELPLERTASLELPEPDDTAAWLPSAEELHSMTTQISALNGKVLSLYRLHASVFQHVHLIPYSRLIAEPAKLLEEMADIAGFEVTDLAISDAKLNGLSNRLLTYNPLTLLAPDVAHLKGRFHPKSLIGQRSRVRLKLRFELEDVIETCNDWGDYLSLGIDCTQSLPSVFEDLGRPLGLGLEISGFGRLSGAARAFWTSEGIRSDLVSSLAPVFDRNYALTRAIYRDSYLKSAPEDLLKIFLAENGSEFDALAELEAHSFSHL